MENYFTKAKENLQAAQICFDGGLYKADYKDDNDTYDHKHKTTHCISTKKPERTPALATKVVRRSLRATSSLLVKPFRSVQPCIGTVLLPNHI